MFGTLFLLAASISPAGTPIAQPPGKAGTQRVTAHATATIRIVSGVRFGPNQMSGATGADRRKVQLADANGLARPAELLEFQ